MDLIPANKEKENDIVIKQQKIIQLLQKELQAEKELNKKLTQASAIK